MKVILLNHAECEEDFLRKINGRANNLLNDTGRRSVVGLKFRFTDKEIDVCFVSPLIRCFETAIMLVGDKCEIIRDERLIQREMGELEGRSIDEYNAFKFWDYKLNRSDYGIESVRDLLKRSEEFVNFLKEEYNNRNVLIVCHDENYRALRHLLLGHELKGNLLDGRIENLKMEEFNV